MNTDTRPLCEIDHNQDYARKYCGFHYRTTRHPVDNGTNPTVVAMPAGRYLLPDDGNRRSDPKPDISSFALP